MLHYDITITFVFICSILLCFMHSSMSIPVNSLGGWTRVSFQSNNVYIDRCRSIGENAIISKYNLTSSQNDFYPIEIYKQLVNGFNYKIVYLVYNSILNETHLYTAVVYTGPFSSARPVFTLINTNEHKEEKKGVIISKEIKTKIEKAINEYTSTNNKVNIIIDKLITNVINSNKTNVYLVHIKSLVNKEEFCIFEDENGDMKIDAVIKT